MDWSKIWDTLLPACCASCGAPPSLCCIDCLPTAQPFTATRGSTVISVATPLDSSLARLITQFKDHGQLALAHSLAELASAALDLALTVEAAQARVPARGISWIPSSKSARRKRGFDANRQLLTRAMRRRAAEGLPTLPLVTSLRHVARNRDQSALSRDERFVNTLGSFEASGRAHSVLLFDDILTTGATLESALTALERSGWNVAGCFALAETPLRTAAVSASRIGKV